MGLDDRDYIRRSPPPEGIARGGLSAVRMWSVNAWLIAACVAVFVVDGMLPKTPGVWAPVRISVDAPAHIAAGGGSQYRELTRSDEVAALRGRPPLFERIIVDHSAVPPEPVGRSLYEWMPPLQRWLYFSTDTLFWRLEVWRVIGFQFLHANLSHLLFNMIALYFFGPMVERYLGAKRYLAFYLLCGIFGALMYLILNLGGFLVALMAGRAIAIPGLLFNSPATPLVGASAGVFGVLMAGAYLQPNAVVLLFFILPMRLVTLAYGLVALALFTVLFGRHNAGGEAGHLGGAIAGFYFIRHPHRLHEFFDFVGWVDPTSHHYRRKRAGRAGSRDEIDRILDKISATGLHSLTESEKRVLREESDRRS